MRRSGRRSALGGSLCKPGSVDVIVEEVQGKAVEVEKEDIWRGWAGIFPAARVGKWPCDEIWSAQEAFLGDGGRIVVEDGGWSRP